MALDAGHGGFVTRPVGAEKILGLLAVLIEIGALGQGSGHDDLLVPEPEGSGSWPVVRKTGPKKVRLDDTLLSAGSIDRWARPFPRTGCARYARRQNTGGAGAGATLPAQRWAFVGMVNAASRGRRRRRLPLSQGGSMHTVYFVTNRNPNRKKDPDDFGSDFSGEGIDDLRVGRATVSGAGGKLCFWI
jgi:hypothetical protein